MPSNITDEFATFAAEIAVGDVKQSIERSIRWHIADTFAASVAGACMAMNAAYLRGVAAIAPAGKFVVPETAIRTDAVSAAACLAGLAHSTEADDGYRIGSYHPGVVCVPTGLCLGLENAHEFSDILAAVIAGYEISCRISELLHPMSRTRGFHNTGIIGVFGAAATAGRLFGLDKVKMRHALGLAASSASGLFAFVEGGETKRLHPAHATKAGIEAAVFAREGMEGPPEVLQGPNGFLDAYAGDGALKRAADLALSWDDLVAGKCYIKPYACCRHIHPGMEAAMAIKIDEDLSVDHIASIDVKTYAIAASHGDVGWEKAASAQLSFRYCVAAMLVHGWLTPNHFSESFLADPVVNELAARIRVDMDDALDRSYPAERPASVRLVTTDGTAYERTISIPLGAPERPLDEAGFRGKLSRMLEPVRDRESADELVKAILEGDHASRLPGAVFAGPTREAHSTATFTEQRIPAAPVRD